MVASEGIDCSQRHNLVVEFLRLFNQITAEQRGLDPTAVPATSGEIVTFESAAAKVGIEFFETHPPTSEYLLAIPARGSRHVVLRRWEGL